MLKLVHYALLAVNIAIIGEPHRLNQDDPGQTDLFLGSGYLRLRLVTWCMAHDLDASNSDFVDLPCLTDHERYSLGDLTVIRYSWDWCVSAF